MTDVARLTYQTGFGNELQSEAEAGALPHGRNSPQQPALGLVSELISGTTFTAPRALNRRTYVFRAMPSVVHGRYQPTEVKTFATPPFTQPPNPNQMRWDPFEIPAGDQDFVDGMLTICGNGSPDAQSGTALHVYRATVPMRADHGERGRSSGALARPVYPGRDAPDVDVQRWRSHDQGVPVAGWHRQGRELGIGRPGDR
ncbi:MAG: homogentisate 1,2-dioxygenase [Streptosporangiaceae bacterium]|jgi:homogentisate 1,2-dioxygenase